MNLNYLFFCLVGVFACFVSIAVARVAIVGGKVAGEHDYNYQVSLMVDGEIECGGAIIEDQFILTAAHCVMESNGLFFDDHMVILAGTNDIRRRGANAVTVDVEILYVPMDYNSHIVTTPGDIAVLKLKHPLGLSNKPYLKKLKRPNPQENYFGKVAKITGFGWDWIKVGKTDSDGGNSHDKLQYAEVDVLAPGHPHYFKQTSEKKQICARIHHYDNSRSSGVCNFDSGGPLVYDDTIIGVLSVSPKGCSEKEAGALYSRVSYYLTFIDDAIHDRKSAHMRKHVLKH